MHHKADNFCQLIPGTLSILCILLTLGASNGTTRNAQSRVALAKIEVKVPKNEARSEILRSLVELFYFFEIFSTFLKTFFTFFKFF